MHGVAITLQDVSYSVALKKKKRLVILDKINACFKPGRLTALMGASGSGKTTLLDVCAMRKNSGRTEGAVLFGGHTPNLSLLREATGYVEQFDTLVSELTVQQMLMYTASLKLPTTLTSKERLESVDEVIDKLGLRKCRHTVIGDPLKRGISGGQAKRVNIGLALITRPAVIFLDEPTSGLDSFMANEVANSLHALAAEGRTIVATIHSPTS
jgi:ABC-type multidrug transport system ATPase subunit